MSISSMTDASVQRKRITAGAKTSVVPQTGSSSGQGRTITPLKQAAEVARYIPTEAIALYVAILAGAFGALTPKTGQKLYEFDFTSRWIFYVVMLVVTAALVWLVYAAKTHQNDIDRREHDVPVFEMVIAAVAMACWAAALPDSPFQDFKWYGGWFAAIVLSTSAAIIPLIAQALGKTAPTYVEADSNGGANGAPDNGGQGATDKTTEAPPTSGAASGGAPAPDAATGPAPVPDVDLDELTE